MNILSIIEHKKNHHALTNEEIEFFIQGYVNGDIPDYQISALLMAIRLNGMTPEETFALTDAMIKSGDVVDLSSIDGFKVDKHSTGGVGDKVTLVVTPILAALGVPVAKFSGRGLGITGGTLDKLESIKGLRVELEMEEFIANVQHANIAVAGQTANIVPADKKLYALRDVTGTVDSIPLIAASIMSKKIASGADGIVLDVKYGNGAFMKTIEDAQQLGQAMEQIGEAFNRKMKIHYSDMNNPLGRFIGNKLEVVEAIDVLAGNVDKTSQDLIDTCVDVAVDMYNMATNNKPTARDEVLDVLRSGAAKEKLFEMIRLQGGDVNDTVMNDVAHKIAVVANKAGVVQSIDAQQIGEVSVALGAGRLTKESVLDFDAGIELVVKDGERVAAGDVLAYLYANNDIQEHIVAQALRAYNVQ
ncbi:thymidine phosphorylase [Caryophanon latum]|uniref:Pyrimidine-nucleoside phosphorylase n=1 Tax=Caryophanon latum TaxID=33977 RepID=A0A1C0YZ37_9BACL|nr:thymidine phosphorylase [Caryophanon latum]OCS92422.1 thymidine phosphorylase [Caryophanon latum]